MSSLKRKEASAGAGAGADAKAAKAVRSSDGGRPTKRAKAEKSEKTEKKADKVPLVSRLKEDEPLFPRGGASVLTPLEYKQIQVQAKNDALFDQAKGGAVDAGEQAKKKRKSKRKHEDEAAAKKAAAAEDSVKIESLNFKRLVKGSLVLGQVAAIGPFEVVVALPNNLVGHLPITAISSAINERIEAEAAADEREVKGDNEFGVDDSEDDGENSPVDLPSLFTVGEYLRVAIQSTEDDRPDSRTRRRIELSIQLEHANAGLSEQDVVRNCTVMAAVASVEDRGYVMDLGLSGSSLRGFLPKTELDPSIPETRMQPGAVLLCLVLNKPAHAKVAQLTTLRKHLGSVQATASTDAVTISTFLPGTAVEVLLSDINAHGLAGKVLGHLDATADTVHAGAGGTDNDLDDTYKVASKIKARVICTFPASDTPKVGVSLLPHILALTSQTTSATTEEPNGQLAPLDCLPLSTIVDRCIVRRTETNVGLWVDVGVPGVPGFVHISRVKDGKVDALYPSSGPYKVGSEHQGRVLGYNAMDGVFLLSFEQRVLDQPFLRIEDVPVGSVVTGTVKKMLVNAAGVAGLIIELADGLTGLVPEMHLADVKLQHPEKKFREGMKVKTRVLSTNPDRHQIRLTLKKTLVNSDTPPVQSFSDLSIGTACLGTIINVVAVGAYVQFYGGLRGFLPTGEMSEAPIQDPRAHFRVGQVVRVRVLQFDEDKNKLVVSCKDPAAFSADKQQAFQDLEPGRSIVTGRVVAKNEDGVDVEITTNTGADADAKVEAGIQLRATLPVGHLSDRSAAKNVSALRRIHVGQVLPELVVLEKHERRHAVILSLKESLITAAREGKLLAQMSEARVGATLPGFVRNITPTAAFVQFAAHLVALLPRQLLPADMQTAPDLGLHRFQSLSVRVVSSENDRLVVSLLPERKEADKEKQQKSKEGADAAAAVVSSEPLVNPVDSALVKRADIRAGLVTKARITAVKDTQLNVQLADNVVGRIDATEVFDRWEDVPDGKSPLGGFHENEVLTVRVLGIHDARKRVYLPITQRSSRAVFELSAKPSTVAAGTDATAEPTAVEPLTIDQVTVGSSWVGIVNNRGENCLWVSLSPNLRGRLYGMEASHDLARVKDLAHSFPVGTALPVKVLRVDAAKGRIDLSARALEPAPVDTLDWDTIGVDMVLPARVTRVDERQVMVQINKTVAAPVHLVDLADDYDQAVTTSYFRNDIVRVSVVAVDAARKRLRLSTRPSRVLNARLPVADREITRIDDVRVGTVVRGFVRSVAERAGLFVHLGGDVVARVRIADLSDAFLREWTAHFRVDQLVRGRVLAVDKAQGQVQLSLKASAVADDYVPRRTLADLEPGQIVRGRVRKVETFGAFIELDDAANVSGLCHRREMADKPVHDATTLYHEGDRVKAKILSIDREQSRLSLGLKPAYFVDEDSESDADSDSDGEANGGALLVGESDDSGSDSDADDEMRDADESTLLITGTDNHGGDDDDDMDAVDDVDQNGAGGSGGGLSGGGFDWSGAALDQAGDDGSVADEATKGAAAAMAKKSKSKSKSASAGGGDVDRTAELDVHGPQTASDFERLLLGQPDSSALWIAYMAFQLQVGEPGQARAVAERAIQTIGVREETERLNVWIAYLNLEVAYGTDETADAVFRRACQYNDALEVYGRAASIYIQSQRLDKADSLFQTMTKKFGAQAPQVWVNYAHFLHHSLQDAERARALTHRALQTIASVGGSNAGGTRTMLVTRLAALEFRSPVGNPERGRTVFESVLASGPKKFDVWNQLLDLEVALYEEAKKKAGAKADRSVVRDVFERGARVPGLKARRAKAWFRRWATWEEANGDAKSRQAVTARAQAWAAAAGKKGAEDSE